MGIAHRGAGECNAVVCMTTIRLGGQLKRPTGQGPDLVADYEPAVEELGGMASGNPGLASSTALFGRTLRQSVCDLKASMECRVVTS